MRATLSDKTVQRVENALRNPLVLIAAAVILAAPVVAGAWMTFDRWRWVLSHPLGFPLTVMGVMLGTILTATAVCILGERKMAAFTQDRPGPNRVGFWGLLQPLADGLKFLLKEDITPLNVDRPIFMLAPVIALSCSLVGFAIIPWGGDVHWPWMEPGTVVSTQVADLNIGVLYLLAVGSIGVYGVVLAGYASNNKYAFYGGMRASAQMISYELPIGLGLLCVFMATGSLRLEEMVLQQARTGIWYVFMYPIPFLILLISTFAETNRAPFDLAEAEQELVGGFHTEYSSMKFAMFFLAEYAHMVTGSALLVAIFFGGWHLWGLPGPEDTSWVAMLLRLNVYLVKVALFIAFFMLIRWTIPRFRFDQLMRITWQGLVPVGVIMVTVVGVLTALGLQANWLAALGANLAVLALLLVRAGVLKPPVTGRQSDLQEIDVRPAASMSRGAGA